MTKKIVIGSGKGGVGKTLLSINIAYGLHERRQRVLLVDCDIGFGGVSVQLDSRSKVGYLEDVLNGKRSVGEVIFKSSQGDFDILLCSAGSGLSQSRYGRLAAKFLRSLEDLNYDFIIFDLGAGAGDFTRKILRAGDCVVVVLTTEPSSFTGAYGFTKLYRNMGTHKDIEIIINGCVDKEEGEQTFTRFAKSVKHYLDTEIYLRGIVRQDEELGLAVRRQELVSKTNWQTEGAKDIRHISRSFLNVESLPKI